MATHRYGPAVVLRVFAIMMFLFAIGMLLARIFGDLDIAPAIIISQLTIGIALMVVAQTAEKKDGTPD